MTCAELATAGLPLIVICQRAATRRAVAP
jgi:hypothetical protein